MNIDLPYGDTTIGIEIPDGVRVEGDSFPEPLVDPGAEFARILANPVDSRPLSELIPIEGRISVLISDMTRGGPTKLLLGLLIDFLTGRGVTPARIEIFIATGMHSGKSQAELEAHLEDTVPDGIRINQHDATDKDSVINTGITEAATECLFNERVVDSALVIGIGHLSFHYFAGFGGARKLILPGVAAESTIKLNHRLSLLDDPGEGLQPACRPGNLKGNPVHEDMLEGARTLPSPVFMINSVAGKGNVPAFLSCGDIETSHSLAAEWFRTRFSFTIDEPYKAVIAAAGGSPKDVNLLQSHKAVRYASCAVDQGGVLLVAAACPEGVGSPSFSKCFDDGRDGVPARVRAEYQLNSQTAISTYDMTGRISIYLKSTLADSEAERFGFVPWKDGFERFLLEGLHPEDILVIRNAAGFLPMVG